MSHQRFCDYCGEDTRLSRRDNCPAPEIERLSATVLDLQRQIHLMRLDIVYLKKHTHPQYVEQI